MSVQIPVENFNTMYGRTKKGYLVLGQYHNGNNSIQLITQDGDFEEPQMTCSVNPPEWFRKLEENEVGIKEWSENAGCVEALVKAGIIEAEPHDVCPSGYVLIEIYRLTPATLLKVTENVHG